MNPDSGAPPASVTPETGAVSRRGWPAVVWCLVGPTAAGKTALAIDLAARAKSLDTSVGGVEVISADSRMVYRWMDIGTAKPDPSTRSTVPHHLVDVVDPDEPFPVEAVDPRDLKARNVRQVVDFPMKQPPGTLVVDPYKRFLYLVLEGGKFIPKKHQSIFLNLFELEDMTVDDTMTPRGQIEAIGVEDDIDDIRTAIAARRRRAAW